MSIAIVGAGNMARQLAYAFTKVGLDITGLYARNLEAASSICASLSLHQFKTIEEVKADFIFLCVNDDAISEVSSAFKNTPSVIIHTSGSTPLSNIKSNKRAVFYPLQTMTKNKFVDFPEVPIFITSSEAIIEEKLKDLAKKISKKVHVISDDQRIKLHLSAVITNNFINHLCVKSKAYLEANDLDYDMIVPLLKTTLHQLTAEPYNFQQTGPAKRGDTHVIEKHLNLLNQDPDLKAIYQSITNSIIHHENHK